MGPFGGLVALGDQYLKTALQPPSLYSICKALDGVSPWAWQDRPLIGKSTRFRESWDVCFRLVQCFYIGQKKKKKKFVFHELKQIVLPLQLGGE